MLNVFRYLNDSKCDMLWCWDVRTLFADPDVEWCRRSGLQNDGAALRQTDLSGMAWTASLVIRENQEADLPNSGNTVLLCIIIVLSIRVKISATDWRALG